MKLQKWRNWGMKLEYYHKGEYCFPNLVIVQREVVNGKYGMIRKSFLRENKSGWYRSMLLTGKLDEHLQEVQKAAEERIELLMKELSKRNSAPDKKADQLAWAAPMNMFMAMAEESVLSELVYT